MFTFGCVDLVFPAWPATSLSGTHLARDPKKFADPCLRGPQLLGEEQHSTWENLIILNIYTMKHIVHACYEEVVIIHNTKCTYYT